jgi:outer membrane lipoprotein carrier protein
MLVLRCLPTLFGLLAIITTTPVWAGEAVQQLARLLGQNQSIEASFTQYILDTSGRRLQEIKGYMVLARPDRFYWKTEAPFTQVLVSDGITIWLYDEDLEQVMVQPLDTRTAHTPVLLLSGNSREIDQQFKVRKQDVEGNIVQFVLHPKPGTDSLYQLLRLYFKAGQLQQMQLVDSLQQTTSLYFHQLKTNIAIDPDIFKFQIPPDVDVIKAVPNA